MIELWIDDQYKDDVESSPYKAYHEPEHSCYRVIIRGVREEWVTAPWDTIGTRFGFLPESIVYVH